MSDWYMENGEYSSVDRSRGIAYDNDNDAWVELGSTPGSTPVWWQHSNHDSSYGYDRASPQEDDAKKRRIEAELNALSAKVAGCSSRIAERKKDTPKDMLALLGICIFFLFEGLYLDPTNLDLQQYTGKYASYTGASLAAKLIAVGLIIAMPIFYYKRRKELNELKTELLGSQDRKQQLEIELASKNEGN